MRHLLSRLRYSLPAGLFCSAVAISASATDKALLDILFENGLITDAQYEQLLQKETVSSAEVLSSVSLAPAQDATATVTVREEWPMRSSLNLRLWRVTDPRVFGLRPETATGRQTYNGEHSSATATLTDLIRARQATTRIPAAPVLSSVACV